MSVLFGTAGGSGVCRGPVVRRRTTARGKPKHQREAILSSLLVPDSILHIHAYIKCETAVEQRRLPIRVRGRLCLPAHLALPIFQKPEPNQGLESGASIAIDPESQSA